MRNFAAWEKADCDECGERFEVTRTEPRRLESVICNDCQVYKMGFNDGAKISRDIIIDEAIATIRGCELVEPNVFRIRLDEAVGALIGLKNDT